MKAIPIRNRGGSQGMRAAIKAGLVVAAVFALFIELLPSMHGATPDTSAPSASSRSTETSDFVPTPLPGRSQIDKMETSEPLPTF